jgi:hypothetical protein
MSSVRTQGRKKRQQQEVISPKERTGGVAMSEKRNHSTESVFSNDLYASWRMNMNQVVTKYLDMNEKMAKGALDWYEKATAWAKDTPWAPLFKTQISSASKMLEGSANAARKWWRLEKAKDISEEMRESQE